MARPALIVGLGGTGQWVLTWLKRDLLLSNNGKLPSNVRLLSIDTATMLEATTSQVAASDKKEEVADVGGVRLDKGEFIYIGGDSRPLAERVRQKHLRQIGRWFHAQRWIDNLAPTTFILDDGAGRLRQFGRLAVFKDILGGTTGSVLWRAFQSNMQDVRSSTSEDRKLEIIVVGSFAGGTGSGMFLDVALILRMLAQQLNIHHVLRGFFALPSVFTNAPDRDMKARTFAAWRELNRFMVINADFPMPLIEYIEENKTFSIRPNQRIFDACYLLEGKRKGQPLADEAKYGVFPMTAEVVSAILDDRAGQAYTQWVFTNLAPEYAKQPDMPMYSAVGAYTVQVPAYFVREISSHEFGQQMLLKLLSPRRQPDEYERLVASGAERHLSLAAPDRNQEDPGTAGRRRSRWFLEKTANFKNQSAKPTIFMGRIATVNNEAADQSRRASLVERLARAGGTRSPDSWVSYFPDLGGDPNFENLRKKVDEHIRFNIITAYSRREGEKADEARAKFTKIPEDVRTRFGGVTSTGEEIEEFYGDLGDTLAEVQEAQLTIFRRLTQLTLQDILTGRDDDALKARSGKLGYAWDFFDGLVDELEYFLQLMVDVRRRREELKPEIKLAGMSKKAESFMRSTEGKRLFWLWEHPHVKGSEQEYLQAQNRLMEVRREDILHAYVRETAQKMKIVAEEARDAIQGWIWHLSTGDDASSLPGLWDNLRIGKQAVSNAHSYDTRTPKVQRLLADQELPTQEADLAKYLGRWQWRASYVGKPPHLEVTAQIMPEVEGEPVDELSNPLGEVSSELRLALGRKNHTRLIDLARRNFAGVVARTNVVQALKENYPDPTTFAREVASVSAEPMFDGSPEAQSRRKSNLIRVAASENDAYFVGDNGLQSELRYINQLTRDTLDDNYGIQVVGSDHPYKLTFVRSDDLYDFDVFAAWEDCLRSYAAHMDRRQGLIDPFLLQNFPAEAQAVNYERRLTQPPFDQEYRPLHPRVVMLLEDPEALRQFVYLGMFGMIREVNEARNYRWELTWEKSYGPETFWLTRPWNKDADEGQRPRPDFFNAMHGYVIMRKTWQEGRQTWIDLEFADRLIQKRLSDMKPDAEEKMIQQNLAEDGLVGWLRSFSYDADVPGRILHRDFYDLALVVEMILRDRIKELEEEESRRTQSGPQRSFGQGGSPFKVYRPEVSEPKTEAGPPLGMTGEEPPTPSVPWGSQE